MSRNEHLPRKGIPPAAMVAAGMAIRLVSKEARRWRYRATHDSLTGVLNRDGLDRGLRRMRAAEAILYVDGTNQKAVNDKLGHKRGDEVIVGTAQLLQASIRPNDLLARIGGDEFLVVLSNDARAVDIDTRKPEEVTKPVMDRISMETSDYLLANPDLVELGYNLAVGSQVMEHPTQDVQEVIVAAEAAMMEAKAVQHTASGKYRP